VDLKKTNMRICNKCKKNKELKDFSQSTRTEDKINRILSKLIFQLRIDYYDELIYIDFSNTNKILLLNQIVMKLHDKKTDDKEVTHKKTITSGIGQVLCESSMI
jgi:hypothetical protein